MIMSHDDIMERRQVRTFEEPAVLFKGCPVYVL